VFVELKLKWNEYVVRGEKEEEVEEEEGALCDCW